LKIIELTGLELKIGVAAAAFFLYRFSTKGAGYLKKKYLACFGQNY